jgi:hypothetical protein
MNEMILRYAEHGLRVFPTQGKKPLIKDWPNLATIDELQIREWFAKYRDANVSILTGSEIFVVDCDGEEGLQALANLQAEHGQLPLTATADQQPSRGQRRRIFR